MKSTTYLLIQSSIYFMGWINVYYVHFVHAISLIPSIVLGIYVFSKYLSNKLVNCRARCLGVSLHLRKYHSVDFSFAWHCPLPRHRLSSQTLTVAGPHKNVQISCILACLIQTLQGGFSMIGNMFLLLFVVDICWSSTLWIFTRREGSTTLVVNQQE